MRHCSFLGSASRSYASSASFSSPPRSYPLLSPPSHLRVDRRRPGRSRPFYGGLAGQGWRGRGAGVDPRSSFRSFSCLLVDRSRVPGSDHTRRIRRRCCGGVELRRAERATSMPETRISSNKVLCLFLVGAVVLHLHLLLAGHGGGGEEVRSGAECWLGSGRGGLPAMVLGRGTCGAPMGRSVESPRRRTESCMWSVIAPNKPCRSLLLVWIRGAALLLLADRDGEGEGHGVFKNGAALIFLAGRGGEGVNHSAALSPPSASWSWYGCQHLRNLVPAHNSRHGGGRRGARQNFFMTAGCRQWCSHSSDEQRSWNCKTVISGKVQSSSFIFSASTNVFLSDDHFAEDDVLLPFRLCHQRWTTSPLLLIPRFNGEDPLRLSSVMVPQNLQLDPSQPRVHTPDRPLGEPPAGHRLVWSMLQALKDCRCKNIESGLSTDERSLFGFIGNLLYQLQVFRSSFFLVVHLGTFDLCSTLCR